jgi:RNA polymerase-binding transcription factor DksA
MDDLLVLSSNSAKSQNQSSNNSSENKENVDENFDVMSQYLKIPNCSILKYGIKKTIEAIKYGYCSSCDINIIHPICMACVENCHKGHSIKLMPEMDHIVCGCGERLHRFNVKIKKNKLNRTLDCPFSEWCSVSGLTNRIKVKEIDVCEFCSKLCGYDKDIIETETKIEICNCSELNGKISHLEIKNIYNNLETLLNKNNTLILDKLDPMKFINIIFIAESSYYNLFSGFDEMIKDWNSLEEGNKIIIHETFLGTNFFLSLKIFCQILGKIKGKPLRYFVSQIINKIDYNLIYKIISCLEFNENKMVLKFLDKLLFLYKKIVLGHETEKF